MGRPKTTKPLNAALLAALRTLSDEVPERCTPAEAWTWVRPITPMGTTFKSWCFWGKLSAEISWRNEMTDHRAELVAAWIRGKKARHEDWPPVPILETKAAAIPQPWTGRDEKPGRVPMDGKR